MLREYSEFTHPTYLDKLGENYVSERKAAFAMETNATKGGGE